ncbi:TerB family tellurite resistance protein [Bacteroides xylanisolvens]|uniref:tellurite resistance TerB family protein n=1 Tax=Bacteroides xylanisolvens TaxID=371601 RepID=UPI0035116D85
MEINELYLKTAFCCMACDGNIVPKEVQLIKNYASNSGLFTMLDVESKLNEYVANINQQGGSFLNDYLKDIANASLTEIQELDIVRIAIQMIEADNKIEYSEISFFKRIRLNLNISDAIILEDMPDKEDYLLPDIILKEYEFVLDTPFLNINLEN